jgi:tripartite-type tricarboxylate transporter receptor subunit TctC
MVVSNSPGGSADIAGRIVGQKLSEALGRPVVIDNRPGGGQNIAAEAVAKSPADGYTLLLATVGHAVNVSLYGKLNYDLRQDLAPVSLLVSTPNILVVHPSVPATSVQELIAHAKTRPDQLAFASAATGSAGHLAGELFNSMAGVRIIHVPYRGGAQAVTALIGGHVPVGYPSLSAVEPHVKTGKLRALAVTSGRRFPSVPDIPTLSEAGLADYAAEIWYGIMVPSGTPREIISRLHAESVNLLKLPDVKGKLEAAGFETIGTTPEQFGTYIRAEIEKWAKVVKATGARPE